jgi:outer membrane receptor protein involved in Fe transport
LQHGVFGQFDYKAGPLQLFFGTRYQIGRVNPSAGFALGSGRLRAHGAVYRSFRAPTLNELYRDFRVGNTDTQPNAALRPETLFGAEAGVDWIGESTRFGVTAFRNQLNGLITNVTLSSTANAIVRQRQNASDALSRGIEVNARRSWRDWRIEAAYLYVDSQYDAGPLVPQVPRHQGSTALTYQHRGTLASVGLRSYSYQFEDDLNHFILPGFASVQFAVDQRITAGLSARLAIDNLLDRQYLVGFSPTPTIGSPRLWRAGLRWSH